MELAQACKTSSLLACVLYPPQGDFAKCAAIMATNRGVLALSRVLRMKIEPVPFTSSRFNRRPNMMDEDRVKWYNWNMACVLLTSVPVLYMYTVNYKTCDETNIIYRTMDPTEKTKIMYDVKLFE
jgi:hypothetical protein